jgi:hypothetical protein
LAAKGRGRRSEGAVKNRWQRVTREVEHNGTLSCTFSHLAAHSCHFPQTLLPLLQRCWLFLRFRESWRPIATRPCVTTTRSSPPSKKQHRRQRRQLRPRLRSQSQSPSFSAFPPTLLPFLNLNRTLSSSLPTSSPSPSLQPTQPHRSLSLSLPLPLLKPPSPSLRSALRPTLQSGTLPPSPALRLNTSSLSRRFFLVLLSVLSLLRRRRRRASRRSINAFSAFRTLPPTRGLSSLLRSSIKQLSKRLERSTARLSTSPCKRLSLPPPPEKRCSCVL